LHEELFIVPLVKQKRIVFAANNSRCCEFHVAPTILLCSPPELIVLVDFKAIYPGVPPGIFAGFPGVAHFLSFEEICQYPRVPQGKVANPWGTLGYYFPGVNPRKIKIPGVQLTFLKHLNITNFLNEQYLVFLCTFLLIFSYYSFHILLIHPLLFFTSCSSLLIFSHIILLCSFFSSHSFLLLIIFVHYKLFVLLQTCILIIYI
jgi:hypothetical protein